ncbi:MAG: PHP domain-containing protein [bacterium]
MSAAIAAEKPAAAPEPRRRGVTIWRVVGLTAFLFLAYRGLLLAAIAPWGQPAPGISHASGLKQSAFGAFHVHSNYSHDGGGTTDEIRRAAADAGLAFVLLTDHNDLRAMPEATLAWPALVVAEEVSTTGGHVLAIGVTEEVRALGDPKGMSVDEAITQIEKQDALPIIAHPSRHRAGWDRSARERVRAIEIYNADEDWRGDSPLDILGSLITYPIAPVRSLALLLDRPSRNLALWDSLLVNGNVVGVGSCDAHARVDLPWGGRLAFPGYWEAFCVVATEVWPWWTAESADSATLAMIDPSRYLLHCLEAGHACVVFRALGAGNGFVFQFRRGSEITMVGGQAALDAANGGRIVAVTPGGHRAIVRIYKDGQIWREGEGPVLEERVTEPGVYRCEVSQSRRMPPFYRRKEFPWIISNAIRIVEEGA